MEKNNNQQRAAAKKKSPGLTGAMAAMGGAAVGAGAFTAAAATLGAEDIPLDGEMVDEVIDDEPIAQDTANYGGSQSAPMVDDAAAGDFVAAVDPQPFDPNEIMLDIDELDIAVVPAMPGEIEADVVEPELAFEPITAEDLMVSLDDLDVEVGTPFTSENTIDSANSGDDWNSDLESGYQADIPGDDLYSMTGDAFTPDF